MESEKENNKKHTKTNAFQFIRDFKDSGYSMRKVSQRTEGSCSRVTAKEDVRLQAIKAGF